MIGVVEGNTPDVNLLTTKTLELAPFRAAYLIDPSYTFTDEAAFDDEDTFKTLVQNKTIIPLNRISDTVRLSEEDEIYVTEQDLHIGGKPGKVAYELTFDYSIDYVAAVSQYSEQYYKMLFYGMDGRLSGYSSNGVSIEGFDTELIYFRKPEFGTNDGSHNKVVIWLADSAQLKKTYTICPDWQPTSIRRVACEISNFTKLSTYVYQFNVNDVNYDNAINTITSFTISDNSVLGTINSITNLGNGLYQIETAFELTYGDIEINHPVYYGSGNYAFTGLVGSIELAAIQTGDAFTEDYNSVYIVLKDYNGDAITGAVVGDFDVTDSTNGTLGITLSTIPGANDGAYKLTLDDLMTSGTITYDDGDNTASLSYSDIKYYEQYFGVYIDNEFVDTVPEFFEVAELSNGTAEVSNNEFAISLDPAENYAAWVPQLGIEGNNYRITFEIVSISDGLTLQDYSFNTLASYINPGVYVLEYTGGATYAHPIFRVDDGSVTIKNITIEEVAAAQFDNTEFDNTEFDTN